MSENPFKKGMQVECLKTSDHCWYMKPGAECLQKGKVYTVKRRRLGYIYIEECSAGHHNCGPLNWQHFKAYVKKISPKVAWRERLKTILTHAAALAGNITLEEGECTTRERKGSRPRAGAARTSRNAKIARNSVGVVSTRGRRCVIRGARSSTGPTGSPSSA